MAEKKVVIIIPAMAKRLDSNINTYIRWSAECFDIHLVVKNDKKEKKEVKKIVDKHIDQHNQQNPYKKASIKLHFYTPSTGPNAHSNAGIAKNAAYSQLKMHLPRSDCNFALLLDDTVNDIIDTRTEESIMSNPEGFCEVAERLAKKSPVFGGTVAAKRHPKRCKQGGVVEGGFLQQALIFSCKGALSLSKYYKNAREQTMYLNKMRRLTYRKVPFGEDVSFQIALYVQKVLPKKKSAQFWDLGVSRIKHTSSTKKKFRKLHYTTKEELKKMIIYLQREGALSINPHTKKLRGIKAIPGGRIRICIKGKKGERPWSDAYNYAFPKWRNGDINRQ